MAKKNREESQLEHVVAQAPWRVLTGLGFVAGLGLLAWWADHWALYGFAGFTALLGVMEVVTWLHARRQLRRLRRGRI